MLSADPNAWLYPIFAKVRKVTGFGWLPPSHQFGLLCDAVALEHPSKAATMREWSHAAQLGMLKSLTDVTDQIQPQDRYELWRVRKGERELTCCSVYLPTGIDVRLFEGDDFRRTRLCKDALEADALTQQWRAALIERGWIVPDVEDASLV